MNAPCPFSSSMEAAATGLGKLSLDRNSPLPAIGKNDAAEAPLARPTTAAAARTNDVAVDEAFRAAKLGLSDVLFYLLSRGAVPFDAVSGEAWVEHVLGPRGGAPSSTRPVFSNFPLAPQPRRMR